MAYHTVVEFNHDKMHNIENTKDFGKILKELLSDTYLPEKQKRALSYYGLKIINQHHSSKCPYIK